MMVSDGAFLVLAGLTSWGGDCGDPNAPGVYTRLGAATLNQWVRDRVPMARASVSDANADPGQTVTFSATAVNPDDPSIPDDPADPGYFTNFAWDFDSDGTTDAQGASVSHTYPADGNYIARVRATGSDDDTAVAKVRVLVATPPAAGTAGGDAGADPTAPSAS